MSTRSRVGIQNKTTGEITSIYVHFDGYLEGVGKDLVYNYNYYEAANGLISQGDSSTLTESYTERGESWSDIKPKIHKSIEDFSSYKEEYMYLFSNEEWNLVNSDLSLTPLRRNNF